MLMFMSMCVFICVYMIFVFFRSQPDCEVIMASNYGDCSKIRYTVDGIPGLSIIDLTTIASFDTISQGQ